MVMKLKSRVASAASRFSTSAVASTHQQIPWASSPSSCIIQDNDLLRKSLYPSGTGLHVLDLLDQGSLEPHRTLYHLLLKKCTRLRKPKLGKIVHAHILNSLFRYPQHHPQYICQVWLLGRWPQFVRRNASQRHGYLDFTLITAYSQHDRPFHALPGFLSQSVHLV